MTQYSLFPKAAQAAGYSIEQLSERLVTLALGE
jgi:D-alanine-D-alanine ligase-like ATP-grasp enzyme